jgi:hypothetical protein
MTDDLQALEDELGSRLRHTFHTVAGTVNGTDATSVAKRRWRRTAALGLAGLVSVAGAAAFAAQNDDAIERLPVEQALMSGETSSGDWWLFPATAVVDSCDGQMPGVILVPEQTNKPGQELNAGGLAYGEAPEADCAPHEEGEWLADPARSGFTFSRLGFERDDTPWGVFGTVHPTVAAVGVTVDGGPARTIETVPMAGRPDGPRYVAFDAPADAEEFRIQLLDESGTVIPALGENADELVRQLP